MKGLIEKKKQRKRIYYYFTLKFLGYLDLLPKVIYVDTQKNLGNIPQQNLGKNILKDIENTSFPSFQNLEDENQTQEEEMSEEEQKLYMAKSVIKHLSNSPGFEGIVKRMKEKYNL